MVLVQATVHRLTVCTFDLQKHQKRGGFRNAPSTSEGSTLREPRARQGNGFPAHTLPSTDRQRTPSRCCASRPAYAPATTSPARCRAGRAKQYNHARNVKPLPPSKESGAGSARSLVRPKRPALQGEAPRGEAIHISAPWSLGCARRHVWSGRSALPGTVPRGEAIHISAPLSLGSAHCLFRPIFLCCSLYHAPGLFPCLFIFSLAGPARRRSPARFLLAKKGRFPVPLCAVARINTVDCLCSRPILGIFLLSTFRTPPVLAFLLVPLPDRK